MNTYNVLFRQQCVGKTAVIKEGLYYHFQCSAELPTGLIYRLFLLNGTARTDLGILVPDNNVFVLNKKLPVSHFPGEDFSFFVVCQNEKADQIEIGQDKPFAYIDRLAAASFISVNGKTFIVLPNKQS